MGKPCAGFADRLAAGATEWQLFDLQQDATEEKNLLGAFRPEAKTRQYLRNIVFNGRQDSLLEAKDWHGDAR